MSSPKSAIDEIFKIGELIESLNSRLELIEKNIKSLNSKFIILTKKIDSIEVGSKKEGGLPKKPSANPVGNSVNKENINDKLVLGSVKTYGYIVDTDKKPIPDIVVAIFDKSKSKIRSIKTNSDGYWEARLPSGLYKIIYTHKNFNDIIREIDIPKGTANFRVN